MLESERRNGAVVEYSDNPLTVSRVLLNVNDGVPRFGVFADTTGSVSGPEVVLGEWTWLLGTADLQARTISLYINGELATERTLAVSAESFPPVDSANAVIGTDDTGMPGFIAATLDEVRVAPAHVKPDWVKAQYLSMTDSLFVFGAEESL